DVLACAEAVDLKINAIAGKLPLSKIADLDRVAQSAAGLDTEVGEDRMARIGISNVEFLGARPQLPAVDFILIRGAPVMNRSHVGARWRSLFHAANHSRLALFGQR